jgi:hypothetical protein
VLGKAGEKLRSKASNCACILVAPLIGCQLLSPPAFQCRDTFQAKEDAPSWLADVPIPLAKGFAILPVGGSGIERKQNHENQT